MDKLNVGIIDVKVGNIGSIINALSYLDLSYTIVEKHIEDAEFDAYIFPGVGSFPEGMRRLIDTGLDDFLREEVIVKKKPMLGICLGFQVMASCSYENLETRGLGWIKAEVLKMESPKVPHVGWNEVVVNNEVKGIFYFVHSYHVKLKNPEQYDSVGDATYGHPFIAFVKKGNIWGVQFHPEKSQQDGLAFLQTYIDFVESNRC